MGITITVGGIAGIPLLVLSGPIIKRIGHANVLFIGFIFHAIRLLGNLLLLLFYYDITFVHSCMITSVTAKANYNYNYYYKLQSFFKFSLQLNY